MTSKLEVAEIHLNSKQAELYSWSLAFVLFFTNRQKERSLDAMRHLDLLMKIPGYREELANMQDEMKKVLTVAFPNLTRITDSDLELKEAVEFMVAADIPLTKDMAIGRAFGYDCTKRGHCRCDDNICCYCGKPKS